MTIQFLVAALPRAQTISQQGPDLQLVSLNVKETKVGSDDWHLSMISTKPPEIHPELGRGTADSNWQWNCARARYMITELIGPIVP